MHFFKRHIGFSSIGPFTNEPNVAFCVATPAVFPVHSNFVSPSLPFSGDELHRKAGYRALSFLGFPKIQDVIEAYGKLSANLQAMAFRLNKKSFEVVDKWICVFCFPLSSLAFGLKPGTLLAGPLSARFSGLVFMPLGGNPMNRTNWNRTFNNPVATPDRKRLGFRFSAFSGLVGFHHGNYTKFADGTVKTIVVDT